MTASTPTGLFTTAEVAQIFGVDRKTVLRWVAAGRIDSIRTPGGHHRFRAVDVRPFLGRNPPPT